MAKYAELVLLEGANEEQHLAILPTSVTHSGDVALVDGELFDVLKTEWIDTESPTFEMICAAHPLLKPEKVLRVKWDKEEFTDADS